MTSKLLPRAANALHALAGFLDDKFTAVDPAGSDLSATVGADPVPLLWLRAAIEPGPGGGDPWPLADALRGLVRRGLVKRCRGKLGGLVLGFRRADGLAAYVDEPHRRAIVGPVRGGRMAPARVLVGNPGPRGERFYRLTPAGWAAVDALGDRANDEVPATFTPADLRGMTGLARDSVRKYARAVGVRLPAKGQRGFRFTRGDALAILRLIADRSPEAAVRERCRRAARDLAGAR